jgi:hypothetical protein
VRRGPQRLWLDAIALESGNVSASGTLRVRGERRRGAFLVQAPLPVGVLLGERGLETRVPADEGWLTRQTARLGPGQRDRLSAKPGDDG